jgi:hypothetical protein
MHQASNSFFLYTFGAPGIEFVNFGIHQVSNSSIVVFLVHRTSNSYFCILNALVIDFVIFVHF